MSCVQIDPHETFRENVELLLFHQTCHLRGRKEGNRWMGGGGTKDKDRGQETEEEGEGMGRIEKCCEGGKGRE